MSKVQISLSDEQQSFVDEQAAKQGFGQAGDYVRDLVKKEQDRQRLRDRLLEGAQSGFAAPADQNYFDGLRARLSKGPSPA